MGRIKTQMIKAVTFKLLEKHSDRFTKDFNENKQLLAEFASVESVKLRNIIAGYITRLKKAEQ